MKNNDEDSTVEAPRHMSAPLRWYHRNKEKAAAAAKRRRAIAMSDPIKRAEKNLKLKEWLSKNPGYMKSKNREQYERDREERLKYAAEYRSKYPEKFKACIQRSKEKRPGVAREATARIRAARRNATPKWLAKFACRAIYQEAVVLTETSGEKYEVDHIVPMCGKTVCGLHVPWNLRVVTFKSNRIKHRRFDESEGLHPTTYNGLLNRELLSARVLSTVEE